jgi:phi LC3 family holin
MNINWKVRVQSYAFWVSLISLLGLLLPALFEIDLGKYQAVSQAVLGLLVAVGVLTDPTTAGLSDSQQALNYTSPKED